MKHFSNRYIYLYATALVAVVAVVLSVAAVLLKPRQLRNEQIEQKQMILKAVGVDASAAEADRLYADNIEEGTSQEGLPVYCYQGRLVILRFDGTGLWGPIWGYMAFDSAWTVQGAVFDHKGETPGLGGEISTDKFAQRFIGKRITDDAGLHPIVLKKHADPANAYEVDAISGGTMTSNGVTAMIAETLERYADRFNNRKEAAE